MRASLGIAAVTALLLSPFAAQAADLSARPYYAPPYYAPPLPVRSPWSGFYVGGFVGASIGQQKLDEHGANQFFATTGTGQLIGSIDGGRHFFGNVFNPSAGTLLTSPFEVSNFP